MINGKKIVFDEDAQELQKRFTDELTTRCKFFITYGTHVLLKNIFFAALRFERNDA